MNHDNGAEPTEEGAAIEPLHDYQERRHYIRRAPFPAIWQKRGHEVPYGTPGRCTPFTGPGEYFMFYANEERFPGPGVFCGESTAPSLFLPEWGRSLADMLKPDPPQLSEFVAGVCDRAHKAAAQAAGYAVAAALVGEPFFTAHLKPENHPPSC